MEQRGLVLVIDDNADNRALAQATLEDEGYRVELASDAPGGLTRFERTPPDCVLLDIRMPGIDGIETCRRIRALPYGGDVPIVFLTAQRDVETFDRAQAAGGDDFLTKPVRPTELVLRVGAAVKLRRLALERRDYYDTVQRQHTDMLRLQLQRDELAAFLVHDFKNPVHTIDLLAERLLRARDGAPLAREIAERIKGETRSLMGMIMNLLDVARADASALAPVKQPLDLGELAQQVIEHMQLRARAVGVALACETGSLVISADGNLLLRVLENLVDNAIRHSPEDTTVTVSAVATTDHVEIRVTDRGAGVPVDQRERIFERFDRGTARGTDNRGLGLTFCRIAIEAHGGRIWVEDGKPGAAFCCALPR